MSALFTFFFASTTLAGRENDISGVLKLDGERERTFIPGCCATFRLKKGFRFISYSNDNSGSNVLCFLFPLAVATEFSLKLAPACTCPFRHSSFRPPRSVWGRVMWLACPVNHNSDRTCPRAVGRWRKNAAAP